MKLKLKINKRSVVLMHTVVWAIIFSLPYIFGSEYAVDKEPDKLAFQRLDTATNFFWMALFYFNMLVLMPYLFNRKHYVFYIVALLFSFFIIMLIHGVLFTPFVRGHQFNLFTSSAHNIVPFLFTVLISLVYSLVAQKVKSDIVAANKQQENLTSELSFLRSQINPHFLFNVLNNIVALVRMKSKELEPTVLKLSSLLQYMLYETDDEKVVLKSEVEYLHAYIDLQKQRYGNELNLQVLFDVKEEWHSIEPMLLIPFIENAFKHGGILRCPEIHIYMSVVDSKLHFDVKNKFEESKAIKDKISGIGLGNVKRRLELLYPNKHALMLDKQRDWFIVNLKINLKA